jgi:hypothetical protein
MSDESRSARALRSKDVGADERSEAAAILGRRRQKLTAPRTRRRQCAQAAKSYWDKMSPTERSKEMARRRRLGHLKKKKAALGINDDDE